MVQSQENVNKIYTSVVRNLIINNFSELGARIIPVEIKVNQEPFDLWVLRDVFAGIFPYRLRIYGSFPSKLINHPKINIIEKGLFAHELAHIANRDLSFLSLSKLVFQGRKREDFDLRYERETKADDVLIARGLGNDYLIARYALEELFPGYEKRKVGYFIEDLEKMIKFTDSHSIPFSV